MKIYQQIKICAVIFLCLFLLGGCGKGNQVVNFEEYEGDITSITFFGNKYEPENVTVIESIISQFMKENPDIRVSYESLKGAEYYEALQKRMAAGKGNDVFMVNHDIVLELEASGQLMDLSGLSTISGYSDEMLDQMQSDGKIYWVPTTVSAFGLYCNLDLLKEHHQKVPENLGEWESVCSYFAGKGITPIIANNDISLKTLAIGKGFYSLYEQNRQEDAFKRINQGEEALSTSLLSGFSLASDFINKGYIDKSVAVHTKKTSDDLEQFVKGNSPFMLTGAWAAGRVAGMAPAFEFEVWPYPVLADGSLVVINADTRLSVNANSEHPEAVMKFVEFFTQKENIQKFADQQSSFSPMKDGAPSTVAAIKPLIDCYQSGRTVIGSDGRLELPIWDLTAQVSQMLLSGEHLDDAMDWLDMQGLSREVQ